MIGLKIVEPYVEFITPKYISSWNQAFSLLIEECGRVSHKSESRIKQGSAEPFIKRIAIDQGHESIIEHQTFTVCFIGSRSMSHQLVRHRIASMTQESMRYCDYSKTKDGDKMLQIIIPPSIGNLDPGTEVLRDNVANIIYTPLKDGTIKDIVPSVLYSFIKTSLMSYESYIEMVEHGIPPEDARYVLPNATKTEVYTTMNLREWRHFFRMRRDPRAQWEIRLLANKVFDFFMQNIPIFFEDLKDKTNAKNI